MRNLSKLKVSLWTRFSTALFMLITPEFYSFRKLKKSNNKKESTSNVNHLNIMKFQTCYIDGVEVRYANDGDSTKPVLILLSPLPQSIYAYAPIWSRLKLKYNVYAYDMPGFGKSEGSDKYMHFEQQGIFLQHFISHFNISKPHIVGPDIGMAAALYYTIHLSNDVESILIGDGPGAEPSINGSLIKKLEKSAFWRLIFKIVGAETFVYAACKLCYLHYEPNQEEIDDYVASYKNRIGLITQWFKNYSEGLATIDPNLENLNKPVLIFWGKEDKLLLSENAQQIHNKIPRSKLHIFDDCGHFSYQDKSNEFVDMLDHWMNSYTKC